MAVRLQQDIEIKVQRSVLKTVSSRLRSKDYKEKVLTDILNSHGAGIVDEERRNHIIDTAKGHFAGSLPRIFSRKLWDLYDVVANYLFDELVVVQTEEESYGLMPRRIARPADKKESARVDQYLALHSAMVALDKVLRPYERFMEDLGQEKEKAKEKSQSAQDELRKKWHAQRTGRITSEEYQSSKTSLTNVIQKSDLLSTAGARKRYYSEHPELLQAYNNLVAKAMELGLVEHLANLNLPALTTQDRVSYNLDSLREKIVPYSIKFKGI